MPYTLVFLRHGQSEGNVGSGLVEECKLDQIPREIFGVSGWQWRLTPLGVWQAQEADLWIRANIGIDFTAGFVSEYIRTMETAGYIGNFPEGFWRPSIYLRERDYGQLDCLPTPDKLAEYHEHIKRRKEDRQFWSAANGESIAQAQFRMDRLNSTLSRECRNGKVIVVSHGEAILADMMNRLRIDVAGFQEMTDRHDPLLKMKNCQVLEYTRVDPFTGKVSNQFKWLRSICPWDPPSDPMSAWQEIKTSKPSSQALLERAHKFPRYFRE